MTDRRLESPSQLGAMHFARASGKYPASIWAQSASIVLECRRAQQNPHALLRALGRDSAALERLVDMANNVHGHSKKDIPPVDLDGLDLVLAGESTLVCRLEALPDLCLSLITRLHGFLRKPGMFLPRPVPAFLIDPTLFILGEAMLLGSRALWPVNRFLNKSLR